MVFSPLAFMTANEALAALEAIVGAPLRMAVNGRTPVRHHFELWPNGLTARKWDGDGQSSCEPDLLVRFDFGVGPPIACIGEMKWDWVMTPEALKQELSRERAAVRQAYPDAHQLCFVIARRQPQRSIDDVPIHSWVEVAGRLERLARDAKGRAAGAWAMLVRTFLEQVDVTTFNGFPERQPDPRWSEAPAFWSQQ